MNLGDSPNTRQLKRLVGSCNGLAGKHILWVDYTGNVHISLLPVKPGAALEWGSRVRHMAKFWYQPLPPGDRHVGVVASEDVLWIEHLFAILTRDWEGDAVGSLVLALPRRLRGGRGPGVECCGAR